MNVNLDDEIEFKLITSSFQSNKIKLKSAFSILNYKKDVITFFERDIEEIIFAYIWNFTNCNYGVEDVLEICDFFIENNFHLTIIKLFEYFARICENLKLKNTPGISAQDRRKASVLEYSQFSLNFLFAYSINFRIKYFDNNGLSYLLTIVSNSKFMKTFHAERFVEFITMNINQLSKDSDLYKSQWLKLNAVHILLKISDEYDKFKIHCYSALSNIATDHQIETIPRIQDIIPVFAKQLNKASTEISLNSEGVEREKIQFYNEEDESLSQQYDVYHVTDDFDTNLKRSLTGILNTLYKLAVSTKIKYDLFVKFNVKDSIRSIILNGVEIEKKYALKLLSQLSFDDQVMDILSKDIELLKFIENLSYNSNCTVHSLPKICKQLLWSLNTSKIVIGNQKMKKLNNNNNQIMISYNASSRDICMKIKRSLTQVGYNVWMDINEIHGSGFESMARAVETSDIILMCVTEKYRQSLNCQAEAQYAFKLKKTIIPIILQNDYEHIDGWLGIIMGDKIYINFVKFELNDAVKKLIDQISLLKPKLLENESKETVCINSESRNSNNFAKKEKIKNWSEIQVKEWFKENNFLEIYEQLKPCDGELLLELNKMHMNAPQFLYNSLKNELNYNLRMILVFTQNFEKLFNTD